MKVQRHEYLFLFFLDLLGKTMMMNDDDDDDD